MRETALLLSGVVLAAGRNYCWVRGIFQGAKQWQIWTGSSNNSEDSESESRTRKTTKKVELFEKSFEVEAGDRRGRRTGLGSARAVNLGPALGRLARAPPRSHIPPIPKVVAKSSVLFPVSSGVERELSLPDGPLGDRAARGGARGERSTGPSEHTPGPRS